MTVVKEMTVSRLKKRLARGSKTKYFICTMPGFNHIMAVKPDWLSRKASIRIVITFLLLNSSIPVRSRIVIPKYISNII